ncbi:hypothetical protein PVAP13_5NG022100 [Panicum virgatum]|uniref:NAC domain-containing protein n=1 Tax=Panicum virgatum TaxID=38727 RepID=A0A8T0RL07_PANVG|nr:hypothetical protein PVAP13_5NG022100 [Panicum virgatum]
MADGFLTRHGFPRGFRFVPTELELIRLLSHRIHRGKLPPSFDRIFHNLRILDYHPEELYERYKEDAEHHYIYFFSRREFQKKGAGGAAPGDKDQKKGAGGAPPGDKNQKGPRLVRAARGGGWKASGGGQNLRWPRRKGGFYAGRWMTLVFYDRGVDKSKWSMHEFVVPVHEQENLISSPPTHFKDLALYRLYILRSAAMESENDGAGGSTRMLANTYDDHFSPSTAVVPCTPVQPWGVFDAGASTSQMPPPPQHRPSVEHAHCYHHHSASSAAARQQAHDMPVHDAGLPGDWCQFVSPRGRHRRRCQCCQPQPTRRQTGLPLRRRTALGKKPVTSWPRAHRVCRRPLGARRRSSTPTPRQSRRTPSLQTVLSRRRRRRRPGRRMSCRPPKTSAWPMGCRTGISTSRHSTITASSSPWRDTGVPSVRRTAGDGGR